MRSSRPTRLSTLKPAFGGASAVLRYLGRYTHRVAISNHRLIAFDGDRVTFRWKDYAHRESVARRRRLPPYTFSAASCLHILPRGFVRIRQCGYLASTCRTARLALARRLLRRAALPSTTSSTPPVWHCPRCGAPMVLGPILSALAIGHGDRRLRHVMSAHPPSSRPASSSTWSPTSQESCASIRSARSPRHTPDPYALRPGACAAVARAPTAPRSTPGPRPKIPIPAP